MMSPAAAWKRPVAVNSMFRGFESGDVIRPDALKLNSPRIKSWVTLAIAKEPEVEDPANLDDADGPLTTSTAPNSPGVTDVGLAKLLIGNVPSPGPNPGIKKSTPCIVPPAPSLSVSIQVIVPLVVFESTSKTATSPSMVVTRSPATLSSKNVALGWLDSLQDKRGVSASPKSIR